MNTPTNHEHTPPPPSPDASPNSTSVFERPEPVPQDGVVSSPNTSSPGSWDEMHPTPAAESVFDFGPETYSSQAKAEGRKLRSGEFTAQVADQDVKKLHTLANKLHKKGIVALAPVHRDIGVNGRIGSFEWIDQATLTNTDPNTGTTYRISQEVVDVEGDNAVMDTSEMTIDAVHTDGSYDRLSLRLHDSGAIYSTWEGRILEGNPDYAHGQEVAAVTYYLSHPEEFPSTPEGEAKLAQLREFAQRYGHNKTTEIITKAAQVNRASRVGGVVLAR